MSKKKHVVEEIKPRETFTVKLTKLELVHVRDLFSILLPLDLKQTVSQMLAASEQRSVVETKLWQKLCSTCVEAGVPLNDGAPDFICAATTQPSIGVFRIEQDASVADAPAPHEGTVFDAKCKEDE